MGVLISGSFCTSNKPLDHPAACAITPVLRQGLTAKQQPHKKPHTSFWCVGCWLPRTQRDLCQESCGGMAHGWGRRLAGLMFWLQGSKYSLKWLFKIPESTKSQRAGEPGWAQRNIKLRCSLHKALQLEGSPNTFQTWVDSVDHCDFLRRRNITGCSKMKNRKLGSKIFVLRH